MKVAKSVEEVCQLVEVGFEYVTGEYMDGGKIFKAQVAQGYSIKLLSGIDFFPTLWRS